MTDSLSDLCVGTEVAYQSLTAHRGIDDGVLSVPAMGVVGLGLPWSETGSTPLDETAETMSDRQS